MNNDLNILTHLKDIDEIGTYSKFLFLNKGFNLFFQLLLKLLLGFEQFLVFLVLAVNVSFDLLLRFVILILVFLFNGHQMLNLFM